MTKNHLNQTVASPDTARSTTATSSSPGETPPRRRRPTGGEDPQVLERPLRRHYSAELKLRVVREAEQARASGDPGAVGALLRREGIYSSQLAVWRRQASLGELASLAPRKRGRKAKPKDSSAKDNERLRRENARLQDKLRKAHIIIDVQKKLATLLGEELPPTEPLEPLESNETGES